MAARTSTSLALLAHEALRRGDHESTCIHLDRARALQPAHADAPFARGRLRPAEGDVGGAVQALRDALAAPPASLTARFERTVTLARDGRQKEAVPHIGGPRGWLPGARRSTTASPTPSTPAAGSRPLRRRTTVPRPCARTASTPG